MGISRRNRWRDIRSNRDKKYAVMVVYRGCSPIAVAMGNNKEEVVNQAKVSRRFERVYVVDNVSGEIVWERKKGE